MDPNKEQSSHSENKAKPGAGASVLMGYLTELEFAGEVHRHLKTIRRWRLAGVGPPFVRVGYQVLYRRQGIAEWLLSREQSAHTPRRHRRTRHAS